MASSTWVSPEEYERREKYLRAGLREVDLMDPYTWSRPAQGAAAMFGLMLVTARLYDIWNKKPFYFALIPRLTILGIGTAAGYGMGKLRERHWKTRDAVIQHYMELHPEDFDHFKDSTEKAKLREEELNEALNRAKEQAESGVVDEETVRTLEGFLSLEGCGWSAKRIQEALELLRKASLGISSKDAQPSKFSFSVSKKKPTPASSEKPSPIPVSSETTFLPPGEVPGNAIHLSNLNGETRVITGQDGFDVKLKDIKNCQLSFVFRPSTVHIQGVDNCKLVFLPVETSILVYDCTKSQIFATAQQLRIHNSHELRLHVGVRAAVIIESCSKIRMAPYRFVTIILISHLVHSDSDKGQ
ncbi:tubulin binding cofactor, partial [Cooperia oncophora]